MSVNFSPESVLVTGARAPAALSAARLFHSAGVRVVAADCCAEPLTRTDRRVYRTLRHPAPKVDPVKFRDWLIDIVDRHKIDVIFPTCEEIFHMDRALADHPYRALLYAPNSRLLFSAHSKAEFPKMLDASGLVSPKTSVIESCVDLPGDESLANSVLKPEYSRFATRTLISPRREQAEVAMRMQSGRWVIQERVASPEICGYAFAVSGHMMACWSYKPKYRAGKGASILFKPEIYEQVEIYMRRFIEQTGWTGQIGMDFIKDADRGLVAIEANPRSTSGIHAFGNGGDLLTAIRVKCRDLIKPDVTPRAIRPAFFLLGLRQAFSEGSLLEWISELRATKDAVFVEGFDSANWQLIKCSAYFCLQAWKERCTVLEATTSDIAWDDCVQG